MSTLFITMRVCHEEEHMNQPYRLLSIYTDLALRRKINKANLAQEWGVSSRTIQRDISLIRSYIHESEDWLIVDDPIIYNNESDSYYLNADIQKIKCNTYYNHLNQKCCSKFEMSKFKINNKI